VRLAVGDVIVYAGHGTGRITARERRTAEGAEQEVVVLELDQGLVVTLPIARARERLRPVAGQAELRRVQETLREKGDSGEEGWQKRFKQTQAKLASGDLLGLAEIVRDGIRKESRATTSARLSGTERQLYLQARQLLVLEVSAARGLDPAEAEAWIDQQVTGS
jgi:RNA polymerase-interacting CarD/CdnL/TRCF family regulator